MELRARGESLQVVKGYGVTLLAVAGAFALSIHGPDWLRFVPFMPYFGAVLLASYAGGLGPGLLASAASVPASLYALEPVGALVPEDPRAWYAVGGFVVVSMLLTTHVGALRRAVSNAHAALHARDEFLSIASHELNTPIAAMRLNIRGLARAAQQGDLGRIEVSAQRIDRAVARLERRIAELLDAARLQSGWLELNRATFDVGALAREVTDHVDDSAMIEVHAEPVVGHWDRDRIDQVITNLLSNAIKYGGGHPVKLTVSERGDCACIEVIDHGPGVAADARDRIFRRFERVASSRNYGGFGLGLWIAREIVVAHGGKIAVTDTDGGGATFMVTLPKRLST